MAAWFNPNDLPQHFTLPADSYSDSESPASAWRLALEDDRLCSSTYQDSWNTPTFPWQWESHQSDLEGYTFPLSKPGGSTADQQSLPSQSHNSLGISMDSSVPSSFDNDFSTPSYALGLVFGTVERDRQSSCSSNSSYASTSSVLSYLASPSSSPIRVPVSLPSPELIPFDPPTSKPLEDLPILRVAEDDTPPTPCPQPLALPGLPSLPSRQGVLRGAACDASPLPSTRSTLLLPHLKSAQRTLEPSLSPSRRWRPCTHLDNRA